MAMTSSRLPVRGGQPPSTSQSLPGFSEMFGDLGHRCAECHQIFHSSRTAHECRVVEMRPSSSHGRSVRANYGSTSPGYSTSSTRREMPTPVSSRSPSIAASADDSYASSLDANTGDWPCKNCDGPCSDAAHAKAVSKNIKEKRNRLEQAEILRNIEDLLELHLGWKPAKPQSSGNLNSSGILTPKIDLMRLSFFINRMFIEPAHEDAIRSGREQAWQAGLLGDFEAFLALCKRGDEDERLDAAFAGSWMELHGQKPCREDDHAKGKGVKRCAAHVEAGARDHTSCRKTRRREVYARRREAFVRGL